MKRVARNADKTRTLRRLVRIALRYWDRARSWKAIAELQMRGSPEALALAETLSRSRSWRRRTLGLYIASQLRQRRRDAQFGSLEYARESTQQLLLTGLHDGHDGVVRAAVSGLGHRPHPAALADLVRLAAHPDSDLRWEVAVALGSYREPESVQALLRLASDTDSAVRDWATFGLGSLHEIDTPEVRELLWLNLQDADRDVRGEAIVGLAERGDPRAVDYLLTHLDDDCRVYELVAAEKLAHHGLVPALQKLMPTSGEDSDGYWLGHLRDAIKASSGEAPAGA